MDNLLSTRIMSNGAGWYWEVVTTDHTVIARGVADSHAQARDNADKASLRLEPGAQCCAD